VQVTLLYFEECPNWVEVDGHLEMLAAEFDGLHISREVVDTPEAAEAFRFRGSPSVLIDGVDPFADPSAPVGLSCRVYATPQGMAGSPTFEQLRDIVVRSLH
jgi:hypothetical protein